MTCACSYMCMYDCAGRVGGLPAGGVVPRGPLCGRNTGERVRWRVCERRLADWPVCTPLPVPSGRRTRASQWGRDLGRSSGLRRVLEGGWCIESVGKASADGRGREGSLRCDNRRISTFARNSRESAFRASVALSPVPIGLSALETILQVDTILGPGLNKVWWLLRSCSADVAG